ncbi:hypothetical protein GCM10025868_14110 [Angustibacter aerolatus]|uniref:ABC transporter domain-containing protein n=1 Tax=Angustibacter aerolatus TaxID=1162965 RepID=A0ABQ6JF02_9ACTN|nr:hypothetical protein GCM10025868_14110 [Angustibacter aerolatus]
MAFARLLVRDVRVVVLDEATARMDPVTEARVVAASQRLLAGRTGVLVAHRLTTTARADHVAVLDAGQVVQQGPRALLVTADGPFRRLLEASAEDPGTPTPPRRPVRPRCPATTRPCWPRPPRPAPAPRRSAPRAVAASRRPWWRWVRG